MALKTGEVAERSGVNLETVRYYEREGLLPAPPRLPSGYRVFTDETVRRIRFIKRAQEFGFTLSEVRDLLALRVDGQRDSEQVKDIAEQKVAEIDRKVKTLESMRRALLTLVDKCAGEAPMSECPILEGLDTDENLW